MRRRTLLATAAALAGAGCSEVIPDPRPTVTTDERTTTDGEPTDSPPTDTDDQTTATNTADSTTETGTPSQAERRAADTLATARTHLADAYDAYVGVVDAENPTLVDVTVGTSITPSNVTNPVGRAEQTLDELPAGANDDQRATADALRAVGGFLRSAARCQVHLADAVEEFRFAAGRIYAGQTGTVPATVSGLRQSQADAAEDLAAVEAGSEPADAAAFDPIGEAGYTAKVEQFRTAVTAIEPLPDTTGGLRRGFDAFRRGAGDYGADAYRSAYDEFGVVVEMIDEAGKTLSELDPPASIATTVSEFITDSESLVAAAADFREAAEVGSRGRRPPEEIVEAGQEHLRAASERVQAWQATTRLLRQ